MDANIQPNDWLSNELKPKFSHFGQLGILLGLIIGGLILTALMQFIILATMINISDMFNLNEAKMLEVMAKPENFGKVVLMQTLGTLLTMALPALIFIKIITTEKDAILFGLKQKINYRQILLVISIAIAGLYLSGGLGELSKLIPLSNYLKQRADKLENAYESGVMIFANMKTTGDYLFSLIMIAVLPAVFEELLFRGALQKVLVNWVKQPHVAIVITAFLFSLVHLSFYGFLSRMMLGIVLGYLYYYGRNIALNMLMHFINNGVAITAMFWAVKKGQSAKDSMDDSVPLWVGGIALIAVIVLLILYKKVCDKDETAFNINR